MILVTLRQVFETFRANKLRTCLPMFGIGWGIMSMILMNAIGEGFRIAQYNGLRALGRDIIIVWGGRTSIQNDGAQAGRNVRLRYSDYEAIRDQATLIEMASPELIRSDLSTKSRVNSGAFGIHGVIPEFQYMRSLEMEWGRLLNEGDNVPCSCFWERSHW